MNYVIKTYLLKGFSVSSSANILVFGDSHAHSNFYDYNNDIQNFGYGTEAPNLSLLKMIYLFKDIKEVNKNIIITISPHNIAKWQEYRWFKNDSSAAILSRHWGIINNEFIYKYYKDLPPKTQLVLHLKKLFGAPNVEGSFKVKSEFKGRFYKDKDTSIVSKQEAKEAHERHFGVEDFYEKNVGSKKLMSMYYDMFSYLKNKNISVFVVGTPIHHNYKELITKGQKMNYKSFLNQIKIDFPEINILNFTDMNFPDEQFLNADHLNMAGAKVFSEKIISHLNNYN